MTHLGIGVMLHMLTSDDAIFLAAVGKTITALSLDPGEDRAEDKLHMTFSDGSKIAIYDDGQSCCERRFMQTDDDLTVHIGATLMDGEIRDVLDQSEEGADGVIECQFLLITTSQGVFTMANYNSHNGYYGGFALKVIAE